jgi:hypothetical protein
VVFADPSGATAATVQFPSAPNNGDIVVVVPAQASTPTSGAGVTGGVTLTARGGASIENPQSPGNFSAANGSVANTTFGPTWFMYETAKTRWVEIV